jgi:hypothetical protein
MHHDPPLGRYHSESSIFRHLVVVSSTGVGILLISRLRSNDHFQSYVYPRSRLEYDNGYLVFVNNNGIEVWRLTCNFSAEDEVAVDAPPNDVQMTVSAHAAEVYHQYAPRGQFRPWALLTFPHHLHAYRLVYPTLICANLEQIILHDVRTGSLVQTISTNLRKPKYIDVNERHAFVCEQDVVHVFSRESGIEVLRIPADAAVRCSQLVEDPFLVSGDRFITPITVSPGVDESPRPKFIAGAIKYSLVRTEISFSQLA